MTNKQLQDLMQVYDSYNKNYFSVDYIMKMFNLPTAASQNKVDIRKYKIKKIFDEGYTRAKNII
jgi:hypothetical protein